MSPEGVAVVPDHGIPKKVLRKAAQLGVHPDCIAGDPHDMCTQCDGLLMLAFDHFYGHAANAFEVLSMIKDDFVSEIMDDQGRWENPDIE